MTEGYLLKVAGDKIVIPPSKTIKNGEIIEVAINRVFVDEKMKKRIEEKGAVRIY